MTIDSFVADDYIEGIFLSTAGVNTVGIMAGNANTYLLIKLEAKD